MPVCVVRVLVRCATSHLIQVDSVHAACGDNGNGQCDLPALEEGCVRACARVCVCVRVYVCVL